MGQQRTESSHGGAAYAVSFKGDVALPIPAAGLEAIEAAPPAWAMTLAFGENPGEVALVDKTTELGNISELTPRIL